MEVQAAGGRLFDVVQATWNLLEPSAGPKPLAEAHALGMGVVVKEALANGRLASRNDDPAFADRPPGARGRGGPAGDDPRCPGPGRCPGPALGRRRAQRSAASEEHLRSNLAAATVAWDLEAEGRLDPFAESPEDYWATRARMPWN